MGFDLNSGWHCTANEPGMIAQFHDFHQLAAGTGAGNVQAVGGELLAVLIVELVAMPMPFVDLRDCRRLVGSAAFDEFGGIRTKPHGAALVHNGNTVRRASRRRDAAIAVELGAVGVLESDDVAGEFNDGTLQAQTDAEEGNAALAGIANGFDLARRAAIVETAGNSMPSMPLSTFSAPSRSISSASILRTDMRLCRAMPAWSSAS